MISNFIFIEILDPDFVAFYDDFTKILTGKRPIKPPHITIRGPYKSPIEQIELDRIKAAMHNSVLQIGPIGRFSNPNGEVLYFNVNSTQLRKNWWKPDFPIYKSGYNPHISLYRGKESDLVDALIRFDPLKRISFLCAEYDIVLYVKKKNKIDNTELFLPKRASDHRRYEESGLIQSDFFSRLEKLTNSVRELRNSKPTQLSLDL